MSATPAPAMARGEEPNIPARNREMRRVGVFGARAQIMFEIVKDVEVPNITMR